MATEGQDNSWFWVWVWEKVVGFGKEEFRLRVAELTRLIRTKQVENIFQQEATHNRSVPSPPQ